MEEQLNDPEYGRDSIRQLNKNMPSLSISQIVDVCQIDANSTTFYSIELPVNNTTMVYNIKENKWEIIKEAANEESRAS